MPPKRKRTTSGGSSTCSTKKARSEESLLPPSSAGPSPSQNQNLNPTSADSIDDPDPLSRPHPLAHAVWDHGISFHQHYPPEMSNDRALAYTGGEIARPYDRLRSLIAERTRQQAKAPDGTSVVMWFRTDLRMRDNRALEQASQIAHRINVPLIACYLISPQDLEAHLTSPARIDFIYRHLEILRDDLDELDIPLQMVEVAGRRDIPTAVRDLVAKWGARHVFANHEYEVDELRRDIETLEALRRVNVVLELVHDTCVVQPGVLESGSGNQYAVYTPWFRAWGRYIGNNSNCLTLAQPPTRNHSSCRPQYGGLFGCAVPDLVTSDKWNAEYRDRIRSLWPAGEKEAHYRLVKFCDRKISDYDERRNFPAEACTSSLSPYLAVGSLSARTCVEYAQGHTASEKAGVQAWISEVAWRDFYRHIMTHWPYVCMNKPFKLKYSNIKWSYNQEHFRAWCEGRTGFPMVDAAMRQLNQTGWMHNRCRMVVASFLCKDLLLDWRMGEAYFMKSLIDGDFASNNGGWGFSAGVGVDPQPYFRIFNPLLQSEKFDADGDYIRKWVPELKNIKGKAIHDPYGRGADLEAKRTGYPEPIVVHKDARGRALKMYKEALEEM